MKKLKYLILSSLLIIFTGCAAPVIVPMANTELESQTKLFNTNPTVSNVYIYREREYGDLGFNVIVDDIEAGTIVAGTYISLQLPPGKHTILTNAFSTRLQPGFRPDKQLKVKMEGGENYFFWQDIVNPVLIGSSGNNLHQVDESTGKREVSKYKMVSVDNDVIKEIAAKSYRSPTQTILPYGAPDKIKDVPQASMERLVLMPLRLGEEDKRLQGAMETALVQGLQQNYIVFAGEQVAQKAREIFLKESRNTAKKECDETRCMQGIAEAFQAELIATANVTKQDGGYFLSLSIQNIFDNKVVYSNSIPCRNCDSFQVVDKLKELSYPSP